MSFQEWILENCSLAITFANCSSFFKTLWEPLKPHEPALPFIIQKEHSAWSFLNPQKTQGHSAQRCFFLGGSLITKCGANLANDKMSCGMPTWNVKAGE